MLAIEGFVIIPSEGPQNITVSKRHTNLMELVYGKSPSKFSTTINEEKSSSESDDDDFFKPKEEGNKKLSESEDDDFFKPKGERRKNLVEGLDGDNANAENCSKFANHANLKNWKSEELIESIRDRFCSKKGCVKT